MFKIQRKCTVINRKPIHFSGVGENGASGLSPTPIHTPVPTTYNVEDRYASERVYASELESEGAM